MVFLFDRDIILPKELNNKGFGLALKLGIWFEILSS